MPFTQTTAPAPATEQTRPPRGRTGRTGRTGPYYSRPPSRSELTSAPPSNSNAKPAKSAVISRFSGFVPICEPSFS